MPSYGLRPYPQKPDGFAQIAWDNPLATGLAALVSLTDYGSTFPAESVTAQRANAKLPTAVTWDPDQGGCLSGTNAGHVAWTLTNQYTDVNTSSTNAFLGKSIFALIYNNDSPAAAAVDAYAGIADGANHGINLATCNAVTIGGSSRTGLLVECNPLATFVANSNYQLPTGVWSAVGASIRISPSGATYSNIVVNGAIIPNTLTSEADQPASTARLVLCGNGTSNDSKCKIAYFAAWNRYLDTDALSQLCQNPYQLLAPPVSRRWFAVTGPQAYSRSVATAPLPADFAGRIYGPVRPGSSLVVPVDTASRLSARTSHAALVTPPSTGASATTNHSQQTYSSSAMALDTASALYGGSNLRTQGGAVQLAFNRPATDSSHVLHVRHEDGTGTSVADDSANANTGTITTAGDDPGWYTDFGTTPSARFDLSGPFNSTDHIDVGSVLHYEYTQPWTFWAAVRGRAGHAPPAGGAAILFTNCQTGNAYTGYELWVDGSNHLHVRIINNFTLGFYLGVSGSSAIIDGNWHVICATYDGSGSASGVRLYVDGAAETLTIESDTLGGNSIVTTDHFWLGNQSGFGYGFPGQMANVRLQNVARLAGWVATHADSSHIPAVDGATVLAYDFTETSGTSTADRSQNGYTGTLSSADVLTGFRMGTSELLYFNEGAVESFPHIAAYNLPSTLTVLGWTDVYDAAFTGSLIRHLDDGGSFPGWGYLLSYQGVMQWWDGAAFQNSGVAATSGWHCYAVNLSGGTLNFWVDGTIVATKTGVGSPTASTNVLQIGNWPGVAELYGPVGYVEVSSVDRGSSYIQQFSKSRPASGIVSLGSPSTAAASGGGDYGSLQSFSQLDAVFTQPTTTTVQYRIGASSLSAADATTQKQAAAWTTLSSRQTLTGLTGRWLDWDVKLTPSTDTLARDTPTLTSLTFTYSAGSTAYSRSDSTTVTPQDLPQRLYGGLRAPASARAPQDLPQRLVGAQRGDSTALLPADTVARQQNVLRSDTSTVPPQDLTSRLRSVPRTPTTAVAPSTLTTTLQQLGRSVMSSVAGSRLVQRLLAAGRTTASSRSSVATVTTRQGKGAAITTTVAPQDSATTLLGKGAVVLSAVTPQAVASRLWATARTAGSSVAPQTLTARIAAALRVLGSVVTPQTSSSRLRAAPRAPQSVLAPQDSAQAQQQLERAMTTTAAVATSAQRLLAAARGTLTAVAQAALPVAGRGNFRAGTSAVLPHSSVQMVRGQARLPVSAPAIASTARRLLATAQQMGSSVQPQSVTVRLWATARILVSSRSGSATAQTQTQAGRVPSSTVTPQTAMSRLRSVAATPASVRPPATLVSALRTVTVSGLSLLHGALTTARTAGALRSGASTETPVTTTAGAQQLAREARQAPSVLVAAQRTVVIGRNGASATLPTTTAQRVRVLLRDGATTVTGTATTALAFALARAAATLVALQSSATALFNNTFIVPAGSLFARLPAVAPLVARLLTWLQLTAPLAPAPTLLTTAMPNPLITFYVGDDVTQPIQVLQSDGVTPQNITGWSLTLLLKEHAVDADALAVASVTGVLSNAPNGLVTFTLPSAMTSQLGRDRYTFFVRAVDNNGLHRTILTGVVIAKLA